MKVHRLPSHRLLAVFLSLCMILQLFSGVFITSAKAASTQSTQNTIRVADEVTMDSYQSTLINDENGSRYAGRLWADKSVVSADETNKARIDLDMDTDGIAKTTVTTEADFAHVFSALGSSQIVNNDIELPLDVVFVLDTSSTMASDYVGANAYRLYQATLALNSAFDALMQNPYNRVALWTYDTNAENYLPLDRYSALSKDDNGTNQYFIGSNAYYKNEGGTDFVPENKENVRNYESSRNHKSQYVQLNLESSTKKEEDGSNKQYSEMFSIHSGTNTHQGLYEGLNTLFEESETNTNVVVNNEVINLQRIPIVILLSDGEPSLVTTSSPDAKRGNENRDVVEETGTITNWWEPVNPAFQGVKDTNRKNLIGIPVDGSWGCAVPFMFMAAHMKQKVNNHYFGTTSPNNYPGLQIVTISVDTEKVNNPNRESLMRATLNPSEWMTEDYYNKYYAEAIASGDSQNTYGYTKQVYESIKAYFEKPSDNITLIIDSYNNTADLTHAPQGVNSGVYPINWETLRFNDDYLDVRQDDLVEYLTELVEDLKQLGTVFTPVSGTNEAGVEDSVTYVDPIGDYMEVKNGALTVDSSVNNGGAVTSSATNSDMSMLLFGQMHSMVKTAIYDYQFNTSYMAKNGETEFKSGWYSSDDPETASYLGNEGSWTEENVYYVDRMIASQFVPTLDELSENATVTEKQQNTVYTFYRFTEDQAVRNQWRLNPSYADKNPDLKQGEDYDQNYVIKDSVSIQENNPPSGVYRLSDIRVWVEDTGDYKDENPGAEGADGLFNGVGFDQALYVNVPANALPLQVAEVTYETDDQNNVKSYTTNVEHKDQSTPLRLFYAVGVQDEIKTENGEIDLGKVSQTYLDSHKDSEGKVFFTSNYFTAGENSSEDRSQGDAVITFSPGNDNRFYVFQKALPIYSKAYQFRDKNWKEVNDQSWEGGKLLGTFSSLDEVKGKVKDGDVVFLDSDVQTDKIDEGDHSKQYYFAIDYYESTSALFNSGQSVKYVVSRSGEQLLASSFKDLHREDMLCWLNPEASELDEAIRPYEKEGQKPEDSEGISWVLATNPGGLRVSELSGEQKKVNKTVTATDSYKPVVSGNSSAQDNNIIIKAYLGNNGVLAVDDSLLSVSKLVEDANGQYDLSDPTPFMYDLYIEDFTGEHTAIRTEWDDTVGTWFRRLSTISAVTDNNGLLHSASNNDDLARYNVNGTEYYVYVPDDDGVIGSTVVYSAPENSDGDEITIGNKIWNEDHTVKSYIAPLVYLVPVSAYEASLNEKGYWSFEEGTGYTALDDFVIATMSIAGQDLHASAVDLSSDYYIRSEYLTTTVIFGDKDSENPNTAKISLSSGQGLLFNGIANGDHYSVNEELSKTQIGQGWKFDSVNGQKVSTLSNELLQYTINEDDHIYEVSGKTGHIEVEANYINSSKDLVEDLYVEKTHMIEGQSGFHLNDNELYQGQEVSYQLIIRNGGDPVEGVTLVDPIPEQMSYVEDSDRISSSENQEINIEPEIEGRTLKWIIGHMETGEYVTVTFKTKVDTVDTTTWWINHAYLVLEEGQETVEPESPEVLDQEQKDAEQLDPEIAGEEESPVEEPDSEINEDGQEKSETLGFELFSADETTPASGLGKLQNRKTHDSNWNAGIKDGVIKNHSEEAAEDSFYTHTADVREFVDLSTNEKEEGKIPQTSTNSTTQTPSQKPDDTNSTTTGQNVPSDGSTVTNPTISTTDTGDTKNTETSTGTVMSSTTSSTVTSVGSSPSTGVTSAVALCAMIGLAAGGCLTNNLYSSRKKDKEKR